MDSFISLNKKSNRYIEIMPVLTDEILKSKTNEILEELEEDDENDNEPFMTERPEIKTEISYVDKRFCML